MPLYRATTSQDMPAQGRLTLTSNEPEGVTAVSSTSTIYYTPYTGDTIALWDGASWRPTTFTQTSLSISSTGIYVHDQLFDIFGYSNTSGELTLEALSWTATAGTINSSTNTNPAVLALPAGHGLVTGDVIAVRNHTTNTNANGVWTVTMSGNNATLVDCVGNGTGGATGTWRKLNVGRATNLTRQDGVLVKSGDATRRYLGTFKVSETAGQVKDTTAERNLYNYENRLPKRLRMVLQHGGAITETVINVWHRPYGGNGDQYTRGKVGVVCGWNDSVVDLMWGTGGFGAVVEGGNSTLLGFGIDTTTVNSADFSFGQPTAYTSVFASLKTSLSTGYHYISKLVYLQGNFTIWIGSGIFVETGASGVITL